MRIKCPICKKKAVIRSSEELSATFRRLYCACLNPRCGHGYVLELTFSHTLSPSALDLPEAVREALPSKSRGEMISLFAGLG